jgi:hypothetical protein
MKLLRSLLIPLLCLAGTVSVHGQALPSLQNGFRNVFSEKGPPVADPFDILTPDASNPRRAAYLLQYQSGTAIGGWATTRITTGAGGTGTVLAGSPTRTLGATTLILPSFTPTDAGGVAIANQGVKLAQVRIGRPIFLISVTYSLGSEIPRPMVDASGQDVPDTFYFEQPDNAFTNPPTNTIANDGFYYSPHARKVYATRPGVVVIRWKERVSGATIDKTYVISSAPAKPERKIFWTENGFNGPKVSVPESRVSAVNIIYNSLMPATVAEAFTSPYTPPANPGVQLPPEKRTLWYDPMDKLIHAYNREGRAFVEYLGNLRADGVSREQLGYEIVNVIKEVRPVTLRMDIGEPVTPPPDVDANGNLTPDLRLTAKVIAGMSAAGTPYLFEHLSLGGTRSTLYAIRQTAPGVFINGLEQQISNEVLIYWQERGEMGILWPRHYAGYIQDWPLGLSRYSLYARPDVSAPGGLQAAQDTAVQLDSANKPILTYQDDLTNQQAVLAPGNLFYTKVSAEDPTNRALLRYTRDEDIWFERIFSRLDATYDTRQASATLDADTGTFNTGFTGIGNISIADAGDPAAFYLEGQDYTVNYLTGVIQRNPSGRINGAVVITYQIFSQNAPATPVMFDMDIGRRIEPPAGSADTLVGFIRQPAGNAFNPETYKNPFVVGFTEAAKGAIIGVNALPGNDKLEVWWYRRSRPPGEKITSTMWPAMVQRFKLRWPAAPTEIVLASNAGSNDLPSVQMTGKIYFQNDVSQPGFNPNEEHAMMINGRAWALRDDLNISTSSQPYVLLSYTNADTRPSMRVFKVLRENAVHKFNYDATAGVILQGPMPLPVLPLPIRSNRMVANYEVEVATPADPVPNFSAANDAAFAYYQKFTYTDRKGTHWVYRGPHAGNSDPTSPGFSMRYYYQTQPGFFFPSKGTQPALGTIVPYLRPADPASPGSFEGDPVTGEPLNVVFTPKWPASVPELRIGETLTVAKLGLPAVRGQTSAQLIYQQSAATDTTANRPIVERQKSARLFDPTRAKTYALGGATSALLKKIPGSVKTSRYIGKTYFPNLPPHLSQRLFFDPAVGANGSLIFIGEFKNEPVGEKYLLLNVMGAADIAAAKALCDSEDKFKAEWDAAVNGLSTTLETFYEDPAKRGTFIVDEPKNVVIPPSELAEIMDDDTAVDSYAIAASGGGQGYVVFAAGNGRAFTPDGEPVSFHIIRVTPPLYRGELKAINSANPLDEKLTLQHTGDFAGHPEEYDFEWRYAPPVDGRTPVLYTFERTLLLGDSNGSAETEWRLINNPGADFAKYRAPNASTAGSTVANLPAQQVVINDGAGTAGQGTSRPYAILRRTFTAAQRPLRLFVSTSLQTLDGAAIYLNGARVATWNVPGQENSFTTSAPGTDFSPLQRLFEIPSDTLQVGANVITAELYSRADAGFASAVNVRLEGSQETEDLTAWLPLSLTPDDAPGELDGSANGKVRHVIQGSSILTLTDNYFIMRYRPRNSDNAAYESGAGWSKWVNPQLAEGWIKRALAGINPFQQRVTDLFNNPVNTDVSLVMQAGKRWEGDISLNLQNINEFGLIEIYETILRRGKMLSIEGNPPINFAGANDALLLAAGYLNDLYMLVGNEAFADAANPTIAFGLDNGRTFGEVATSLFAFKGQQATVLDEELGMLRGRDDFLAPGTRVAPVYNRLFWNYTRGIDSGEAIYALNYNIATWMVTGSSVAPMPPGCSRRRMAMLTGIISQPSPDITGCSPIRTSRGLRGPKPCSCSVRPCRLITPTNGSSQLRPRPLRGPPTKPSISPIARPFPPPRMPAGASSATVAQTAQPAGCVPGVRMSGPLGAARGVLPLGHRKLAAPRDRSRSVA